MSDLAFNNYCVACDKLCLHDAIYCSDECKSNDEVQSHSSAANSANSIHEEHLASPLLTPSLYQHHHELHALPLLLSAAAPKEHDVGYFDLNYNSIDTSAPATNNASSTALFAEHLPSTSHNYRKWLTACL